MPSVRHLRLTLITFGVAGVAFAAGGARLASAYPPPPASGVVAINCTAVPSGSTCPVRFAVVNANGSPAGGVQALFAATGGTVSPATATTDAAGVAAATFTGTSCGTATVSATASDGAAGQASVPVTCQSSAGAAGLPTTSTLAPATGRQMPLPVWAIALLAASGLTLLGSATALWVARRRV